MTSTVRAERRANAVRFVGQVFYNRLITHLPARRVRRWWLRALGVGIAPDATVFTGTMILGASKITIGHRSQIGWGCLIDGRGGIDIGDDVVVASGSCIISADHDVQSPSFEVRYAPVRLEHHVWLGTEAMVLKGVTVASGAVLAARAVATRDVAPLEIVAGSPARSIGARQDIPSYRVAPAPRTY